MKVFAWFTMGLLALFVLVPAGGTLWHIHTRPRVASEWTSVHSRLGIIGSYCRDDNGKCYGAYETKTKKSRSRRPKNIHWKRIRGLEILPGVHQGQSDPVYVLDNPGADRFSSPSSTDMILLLIP